MIRVYLALAGLCEGVAIWMFLVAVTTTTATQWPIFIGCMVLLLGVVFGLLAAGWRS